MSICKKNLSRASASASLIATLCFALTSCASRPQLYPNEKLRSVGKEAAARDIESCEELADEYMDSGKGKEIAKGAGGGAVLGAAIGAVSGIFAGDMGRGAVLGGAVGGTAGAAGAALSPDEVKRNYVNTCLDEKGYKVMGWK